MGGTEAAETQQKPVATQRRCSADPFPGLELLHVRIGKNPQSNRIQTLEAIGIRW